MKNILVIIPARGGSKGIPRKNLRLLGKKPLLYYSVKMLLSSKHEIDVYVSSEDKEILNSALHFGAKVHERPKEIANDQTTLDPVIYECFKSIEKIEKKSYDIVATVQPTSPLLHTNSFDKALDQLIQNTNLDTIISAKENTHLSWKKENNQFIPNYTKRVNRQFLTPNYTETGGFLISRAQIISSQNRIGTKVSLHLLSDGEDIDIDTYQDWNLCEYYLNKKKILFVITGNQTVGLGHVYNTLLVANDILNHQIIFLVDLHSQLAYDKIKSNNYPVYIQKEKNIIDDIKKFSPDLVINDCLDTDINYMKQLRDLHIKSVNFEDLGSGAQIADKVINAIYPEKELLVNHYFGQKYFILRDEFIYCEEKNVTDKVNDILITFGGVDPNNYTKKVVESVYEYCENNDIKITIILGFGYQNYDTLSQFKTITIKKNVSNISKYMLKADLIFTSAGRTIYEVASIGTPAIVLAQNEREMTHFFANEEYGFINLDLGYKLSNQELLHCFTNTINSTKKRVHMNRLMKKNDLKSGRKTVNKIIQEILDL